ncbi:hypothetical protein BY458DRAFT_499787 [Sporodiniella umbellata]|nr:hypothetical protein BY458DRAFT_499787 [Sporodiniella umbellata]
MDNLRTNKNERNRYMATTHGLYWDENLEMTIYYNIINSFHQHVTILHDYHTEQDHDSYEFFTKEIFKSDVYVKHKMSKQLIGCVDYIPDYKLAYEYQHGKFADLLVMEVKKDKKDYTPDTDDVVKINLELQIMLNKLILLNVIDPVVYGMVIQEHECTLFQMTLKQEGQYISHVVDSFYLPRNKNDVSLIPRVASIFLSIKDMVDDMVNKIKNRSKGKAKLIPFMKEGMSLPCPIKDPLKFFLEQSEANCNPPM